MRGRDKSPNGVRNSKARERIMSRLFRVRGQRAAEHRAKHPPVEKDTGWTKDVPTGLEQR